MNFFKNPNFDSIKILAGFLLVFGAGYFLFSSGGDRGIEQSGKVLKGDKKDFSSNTGDNYRGNVIVSVATTFPGNGTCQVTFTYEDGSTLTLNGTPTGTLPEHGCTLNGVVYGEDGQPSDTTINILIDKSGEVVVATPNNILTSQVQLWMQGFLPNKYVTGTSNPQTSTAVSNFQSSLGIIPTGTLDSTTREALSSSVSAIESVK